MSFNIIMKNIHDRRVSLVIYAAAVAAYGLMMIAIWPSLSKDISSLEQLWEQYPEGLKEIFGASIPFTNFDGFLTLEYFSIIWIIIAFALSAGVATGSLAGEIDKGTMELLLSQPVSRRAVVTGAMAFHALALIAVIAATMIPIILGAMAIGADLNRTGILALSVLLFLFTMSLASLGFMFSAWYSERGKALFTVVGILIFSYALDILAKFSDFIDNFHFLSLFKYYQPYPYISNASIDWGSLAVYAGISVIASIIAIWHFERRDIAV